MGLASVVHNGLLHSPPKLDLSSLLRATSPSQSQSQSPKFSTHRYAFPSLRTDLRRGHFQFSPISCSRGGTEQQDDFTSASASASDKHGAIQSGCLDINNVDISRNTHSTINSEKIKQNEHFVSSVRNVALWVGTAVAFGIGLGFKEGVDKASEFFTGYILEQSLSVDNLFVFVLVFKYFKVPKMYQNQVLSYGIAGAVVFRLAIILLGTATIQRFEAVNILLAAILLYSSFKLFATEEDDSDLSDNFVVKTCQRFIPVTANYTGNRFFTVQDGAWKATPLLFTVAVIELSDIAFAVDSIPAVFGCTRDPFIVYTSNIFAIVGLRSLYTLISEGMSDLEYLQPSIGVVLGFIGCKMILDYFGFHVSTEMSLGFVATSLSAGVALSLLKKTD